MSEQGNSEQPEMTPKEAREWLLKLYRLTTGQLRIAKAENSLRISLLDAVRDDALVVIFAEETRRV